MHSKFKQGDLVLVHPKSSYEVGDIVLYKNPDIGPVFHRIIGIDGDKFFIKGDNNSWVDSYQPTVQDIYGSLWIHLSYAGYFLKLFGRQQFFLLLLLFLVFLLEMYSQIIKMNYHGKSNQKGKVFLL
jgi:signal peptidase